MPPTSSIRKTSLVNQDSTTQSQNARRSQSGRAIRTNTTRPANYYARPFGSFSVQSASAANETENDAPPGFFPAITYFTDAITALPKEVMRHFTLLKEVEAKIHAPGQKLDELVESLLEKEVPRRRQIQSDIVADASGRGLLGFGITGSISGSANPSVVNGVAPNVAASQYSAHNSIAGSINGEGGSHETEDDLARRKRYHEARLLTHQLLANLDEKNTVLAQTNELLASQLMRMEDVWPHVEAEIPEDARLGSMAHWAYSDNRQKRSQAATTEKNRRDVAATNSLAAAASAMHEIDIAAARQQAGREATKEKHRGRQAKDVVDSDFDEKPRKGNTKAAKAKPVVATGLGITNGEPVKKRKIEKPTATGMERSTSTKGKAARETPRSTPAAETSVKKAPAKTKPAPPPKKRGPGSAANSPAMASSPLASSFNPRNMEPPSSAPRPTNARLRQNSSTNLRHEKSIETTERPASSTGKANGNNKRKAPHDSHDAEIARPTTEPEPMSTTSEKPPPQAESITRQDTNSGRNTGSPRPPPSRANSGRNSKTSTPRNDSFPEQGSGSVVRTRSTRSKPAADGSGDEIPFDIKAKSGHKRLGSNSHILKQLAPYNKSPDMDRHRKDDMDEDLESDLSNPKEDPPNNEKDESDPATKVSNRPRRAGSGRSGSSGKQTPAPPRKTSSAISPPPASDGGEEPLAPEATHNDNTEMEVEVEAEVESGVNGNTTPTPIAADVRDEGSPIEKSSHKEDVKETDFSRPRSQSTQNRSQPPDSGAAKPQNDSAPDYEEEEDDEDDESEHDPDDPNEPKYCYCQRGSYGEMVACDNDSCPREWFHLGCTELKEAPGEDEQWYCRECRPRYVKVGRGRGRGRG